MIYFPDEFYDDPRLVAAGDTAAGVLFRMWGYSGRQRQDGFVPASWADKQFRKPETAALISVGLIEDAVTGQLFASTKRVGKGRKDVEPRAPYGGYWLVDYLRFNPTREEGEAASQIARGNANKRWHPDADGNADGNAAGMHQDAAGNATAMLYQSSTRPSTSEEPSGSPLTEDEALKEAGGSDAIANPGSPEQATEPEPDLDELVSGVRP